MAIVLGLLSALLWGVADLLGRFAGRAIGPARTLFYAELIGAVGLMLWFSVFPDAAAWRGLVAITWPGWAWLAAVGVVHLVGAYALTRGLTIGPIALVMPIVTAYGAISAVLAILFGEALSQAGFAGIGITVVGTGLAAVDGPAGVGASRAGVPWALLGALCYGVSFFAQGHFMVPRLGGLASAWLFLAFGAAMMLAIAAVTLRPTIVLPPPPSAMLVTFGSGALAVGGYIAIALGFATGHVAIVAVLSTLSSVVTAMLGYTLLGERLARHQWLGAALIIVGVGIINAG
jgi:drug/metabolite transporter (DMT)-like permease